MITPRSLPGAETAETLGTIAPDRPVAHQPRADERGGGGAGEVDDEPGGEERLCGRRDHSAMTIGFPRD